MLHARSPDMACFLHTFTWVTFFPVLVLLVSCKVFRALHNSSPVCALIRPAGGSICMTALIPVVARFTGIPRLYRSVPLAGAVWLVASATANPSIAALLAVNVSPHSRCLRKAD